MKLTTTLSATLFAFATTTIASPSPLESRDVFAPRIIYPNSGTKWVIGMHHNVTWDVSNAPDTISNEASVSLVKGGRLLTSGPGSTKNPLARGFDLRDGGVGIRVPEVIAGDDYQIVLFGDSGNWGPLFSITS